MVVLALLPQQAVGAGTVKPGSDCKWHKKTPAVMQKLFRRFAGKSLKFFGSSAAWMTAETL